ncbi:MAG: hypothetical protein P9X24_09650, partial [Candidatus Hatepunaea meridiana]|nr:hypothetical protein [Candidatus Hatepunaea meridiana]
FIWILIPFCHSREGGNPGETIGYLDSRLRGNDKRGTFRSGTKYLINPLNLLGEPFLFNAFMILSFRIWGLVLQ